MIRTLSTLLTMASFVGFGGAADKNLQMKDLPPAVQKTVQEQLKGGEVKSIGKETDHGVVQYEVETMLNGKHRDFEVDRQGTLLVVEDETSIDSIPAAAKAAILKKVGAGKLNMVETMTKGNSTFYEAAYRDKSGRKHQVLITAAGVETKE